MNYIEKIEEEDFTKVETQYLKRLGFKKRFLSDKSGYWFEKTYKISKKLSSFINITIHYNYTSDLMVFIDGTISKKLKKISDIKAIDAKIIKIATIFKSI